MRELRKLRKLTLAALAQRVGCAESYLSRIENGTRKPGLELAFAIQGELGLRAKDWLRVA
jgi:transcriptional regulator with XRE-family HTH domain